MAITENENTLGFIDKRRPSDAKGRFNLTLNTYNYNDVHTMRSDLAGRGYSTATLDTMTKNDMVYALRLAVDAAGI